MNDLVNGIIKQFQYYKQLGEKTFSQFVRPTVRYILPEFGCRSPLRRPHPDKISHKL